MLYSIFRFQLASPTNSGNYQSLLLGITHVFFYPPYAPHILLPKSSQTIAKKHLNPIEVRVVFIFFTLLRPRNSRYCLNWLTRRTLSAKKNSRMEIKKKKTAPIAFWRCFMLFRTRSTLSLAVVIFNLMINR